MIYVRLSVGLGNQLFQYAFYRQLCQMGYDVAVDETQIIDDNYNINIKEIGISYRTGEKGAVDSLIQQSRRASDVLKKRLFNKGILYKENENSFDHQVYRLKGNHILCGYWQSEQYFKDVVKDIRDEYTTSFTECIMSQMEAKTLRERMEDDEESISIHIRGGDYLEKKYATLYQDICTVTYYEKAIQIMREKYHRPTFYIFTDDYPYTISLIEQMHVRDFAWNYVNINAKPNAHYELALMSRCKHQIIANSSFSWWGSYLNTNPQKTVIAPTRWINSRNSDMIYYDGMIRI